MYLDTAMQLSEKRGRASFFLANTNIAKGCKDFYYYFKNK
jgi:hypothetical protein